MSVTFLGLFLLTLLVWLPPGYGANSTVRCLVESKSVKRALKHSAAVFSGEVIELKKGGNFTDARFRVERFWKGVKEEEVSVIEHDSTAESPHYRLGEKYLVFAESQNGKLFTGNCSRTKKIEHAQGDLQQLGEGRALVLNRLPPPLDLSLSSDGDLQQHLGKLVTMRGRFSLNGKVGPFIIVGARPIYLVSRGSFSWGKTYERMEGRDVRVTGTLRFFQSAERGQELPHRGKQEARVPDHFYFEVQTAKVELIER